MTSLEKIEQKIDHIIEKIEPYDGRFAGIDKKFDRVDKKLAEHDAKIDRVINKLVEHGGRLNSIEQNMVTKKDHQEVMATLDKILGQSTKYDQEIVALGQGLRRVENAIGLRA